MSTTPAETEITRIEVGTGAAARSIAMRIFRTGNPPDMKDGIRGVRRWSGSAATDRT